MGKRGTVAAILVIACSLMAYGAANPGKVYEFIQTDRNVALFSNLGETTFTGLRVIFAGEVDLRQAIGIGANVELASNKPGVLVLEGEIPPMGMIEIDWSLNGPRIVAAGMAKLSIITTTPPA